MTPTISELCEWLASTSLSTKIQSVQWLIPAVQTVHLLSIAIVMSGAAMVYLSVLGILPHHQSLADVAQRFLPCIWWTLVALLVSGAILIIGEPARSLPNPAFLLKMTLLGASLVLTFIFQRGLRHDVRFWESSRSRRIAGRSIAVLSLMLWIGVVFAGRWIAYADVNLGLNSRLPLIEEIRERG